MALQRTTLTGLVATAALALAPDARLLHGAPDVPRRIEIVASRYAFDPAVVVARLGEPIELVLRSADTDHGIAIKAYGVKAAIPKGGGTVSVLLVADKPGRFLIECSEYCGSGHKKMRGELVVAEEGR
jgi:cytochrome c oxidase subunit 2